jgi:glycosyltransferase involved in cell wall biosynthesis
MPNKRIYILYPDGHIAYSPTTLNLYDTLVSDFDVTIFSYEPDKKFSQQKPGNRKVRFIASPGWIKRIFFGSLYFFGTKFLNFPNVGRFNFKRQMNLYFILRWAKRADAIIAVDLTSVWIAQKLCNNVHLVSLEIYENDPLLRRINKTKLKSIITQSPERYKFYFPNEDVKVFFVPNSPVYKTLPLSLHSNGLLFHGTAVPEFGIWQCIRFIEAHQEYSLTIKGSIPALIYAKIEADYSTLLSQGKIKIDREYLEPTELVQFISKFRIGFCFYDTSFQKINAFNYLTAPSGKLMVYLAAGLPVICNNLPGLALVSDNNCGVLIDDMSPESINKAIQKIEADYNLISSNCNKIAQSLSFDKKIAPFVAYLKYTLNGH